MPELVNTDADVSAVLPVEYKNEETAPVRDALVHAHAEQQKLYQQKSAYAASQADIRTATGRFLTALGRDRGYFRQGDESDVDFRARILSVPVAVTPDAIVAAVNSILDTVGGAHCKYLESIADRFYVNSTGGTGNCAGLLGVTPINPTRLYPEDGGPRNDNQPAGAWVFSDHVGRYFILRVPSLASLDTSIPTPWTAANASTQRPLGTGSLFPRSSSGAQNQSFIYRGISTALDTYKAIADTVSRLVGHSIRWKMISDVRL